MMCIRLLLFCFVFFVSLSVVWSAENSTADSQACLECHDGRQTIEVANTGLYADEEQEKRPLTAIVPKQYNSAVHAKMGCRDCHTGITSVQPPHQSGQPEHKACLSCHQKDATGMEAIATHYEKSIHARINVDDPQSLNASCEACHDSHFFNIPKDKKSQAYAEWQLSIPKLCGQVCHTDELDDYRNSVHGTEFLQKKNLKSANCIDCHSSHDVGGTRLLAFQLQSPKNCATCHPLSFSTYRETYHGRVFLHGDIHTAKCFNCHEAHKTLRTTDLKSRIHPNNRLKTCEKCHDGKKFFAMSKNFLFFSPHARTEDYAHYPEVFIASHFMFFLISMVFLFFGLHSVLWFYREWQERKKSAECTYVDLRSLGLDSDQQVQRFTLGWRIGHLAFALVVMVLALTGISLRYGETFWAPKVVELLGGVPIMGMAHRTAAALMTVIFFFHVFHLLKSIRRNPHFSWFGPDSLLPNWQDLRDCQNMFKWFLGRGEKPRFDRWSYFEKFDYWAVFWGIASFSLSGLLLAFPEEITARYFQGWIFNVAFLVHGDEAFLAIVFLFTVHFFNNHFRPSLLPPPNIVMFTGLQSLESFQQEHPLYFERLLASGELTHHLRQPPSPLMTVGSKALGLLLIAMGFVLLFFVLNGFIVSI
ncbi:MAG: hypothetical protein H7832_08800 [Magnetococcus sp. DMHC-6]